MISLALTHKVRSGSCTCANLCCAVLCCSYRHHVETSTLILQVEGEVTRMQNYLASAVGKSQSHEGDPLEKPDSDAVS